MTAVLLPGPWALLTLAAYGIALLTYHASGKSTWCQPVVTGVTLVAAVLLLADVSYENYLHDNQIIDFLLGTATVALAVPLYQNIHQVRGQWLPLLAALVGGGLWCSGIAVLIAWLLGAAPDTLISMAAKSVTTPFAIAITQETGGLPGLAAAFVIISGMIVAAIASPVFVWLRIDNPVARGSAMGMIGHGIATARAVEMDTVTAAVSALSMGLMGLYTSLYLPWAVWIIRATY